MALLTSIAITITITIEYYLPCGPLIANASTPYLTSSVPSRRLSKTSYKSPDDYLSSLGLCRAPMWTPSRLRLYLYLREE